MMFPQMPPRRWLPATLLAVLLAALNPLAAQTTLSSGAVFGDVVSLGGTPSDLVLDEYRGRIYAVSSGSDRVNIYDYVNNAVAGSILVGSAPSSASLSMDSRYLY